MASPVQTKQLTELSEQEVGVFLTNIKFHIIKEKLLSGEYGEITGEFLVELDDETLQTDLEITKGLVRKQFLKALTKYKNEGVPIELLIPEETPEKITEEIAKKIKEEIPNELPEEMPVVTESPKARNENERSKLNALLEKSKKIKGSNTGEMDVYSFPAKKTLVKELKKPVYGQNLKKIIIMGETGTGKSTLLDAFVNYAAGVEMDDPFRFKLVVDEADRAANQSKSQTSEISGYLVQDTQLDFAIQIWDTPGFGDTGGVERDEEIKQQINALLKVEDFCHAICFVVKGSVNRLTPTQKYIIDRVLLFFGKEAIPNIFTLVTFADDNEPEVLGALKESNLPFDAERCFAFNNKILFTPASQRKDISKIYWKLGNSSIEDLFKTIATAVPFSLNSTKGVIEEREDLFKNLNAISGQIDRAVFKISKWEKNIEELESQKDEVTKTGKFKQNIPREVRSTVKTQNKNTICNECSINCHEGCGSWGMYFCDKFNWDWECKICDCKYDNHTKENYKYEVTMETYEVIDTNLKAKHDQAKDNLTAYENAKENLEKEKNQEHGKLKDLITTIKKSMKNLKKNALLNYSMDMVGYFKTIANEQRSKGNFEQANAYEKMIKQEEMVMSSLDLDENQLIDLRKQEKVREKH